MSYNVLTKSFIGDEMKYYNIHEAAAIISCHPNHLRRIARQGKIEFFKAGSVYRFTEEQIKKYVEGGVSEQEI